MKICGLTLLGGVLTLLLSLCSEASSVPTSLDYDSVRDMYEGLLRASYPEWDHNLVRKDSRSPQFRLRFGRRSAPSPQQEDHRIDHMRMDYFEN